MATLLFSALGRAIGGRGGAVVGALLGRQIDRMILAPSGREGPRLQDLAITASSYGEPIARHFGRMRVGGTIIWATDLRETRHTSGGGKGRPAQTAYSYAASFAVALSSRPLKAVGRIWADGVLLRGAAGDLKTGGSFRFHAGHGDQPVDPLICAAEGAALCPAFRGLAYGVFEDLQLGDFGNRIPTLSFEVFGPEDALDLALVSGLDRPDPDDGAALPGIGGLSLAGPAADLLAALAPLVPFACDLSGDRLTLIGETTAARALPESTDAPEAHQRRFLGPAGVPLGALRYYDVSRDYQPGIQRAPGCPAQGQPQVIELPLALESADARELVEAAARRANWARQSLTWRTATIDPQLMPGVLVQVPGQVGLWRLTDWEWRADGLELTLWRVPGPARPGVMTAADPGRAATAPDLAGGATVLRAFELPWDGIGSTSAGTIHVAASSAAAGWAGAALYGDDGAGGLRPVGSSGRRRCVLGTAIDALPDASSLLPDRASSVTVDLLAGDLDLEDASGARLAGGANRALLGEEFIQFARAVPLGAGVWRLSGLLRGRGGTEAMTGSHRPGEGFVLLDDRLTVLDGGTVSGAARLVAIGLADPSPVAAEIALPGMAVRPLCPVHPIARTAADGALVLRWTRRARGAWVWADGADVPLNEEAEAYEVLIGSVNVPLAAWQVGAPELVLPAEAVRALRSSHPGAPVLVRQRGSHAVSLPVLLTHLA